MNIAPCDFWRQYEHQYPTLASLARDIFSIPATGAGVEQLFSSARDICHYRRGALNGTTIQDLMMLHCALKSDIKEEDRLANDDTMLTPEERQAEDELREAQLPSETPEPISDSEEEDSENNSDPSQQPQSDIEVQSQYVTGK